MKQVQAWLGHADPAFTARTYIHLMDEGLGDADFLDELVTAEPPESTEGAQAEPLADDEVEPLELSISPGSTSQRAQSVSASRGSASANGNANA